LWIPLVIVFGNFWEFNKQLSTVLALKGEKENNERYSKELL